jgi:hypothetical protein
MTLSEHREWPFTKLVFAVVVCAAFAIAVLAISYPVYMYQLGR